ncbi:aspartyl-phosphate phosphatase Spo0E family protein [Lentibacillus cibarius]|nr:aspartyl-phosphate phosphatase Spo0E family protein [Lentibacillus cibarius]
MTHSGYDTPEMLFQVIKQKRKQMIETANIQGMESADTLKCSQELDVLILKYQRNIKTKDEINEGANNNSSFVEV